MSVIPRPHYGRQEPAEIPIEIPRSRPGSVSTCGTLEIAKIYYSFYTVFRSPRQIHSLHQFVKKECFIELSDCHLSLRVTFLG